MKGEAPKQASGDLQVIEAAEDALRRLCRGEDRFRMSIPAQPDRDTDLVIGAALRVARQSLKRLDSIDTEALATAIQKTLRRAPNQILGEHGRVKVRRVIENALGKGESDD